MKGASLGPVTCTLGAAVLLAFSACAQAQIRPPQAQAWIDVATFSGMGIPGGMGGMGGGMAALGALFGGGGGKDGNRFANTQAGGAGRWVDVTLYARANPSLSEAQQEVPPGFLSPALKLESPKQARGRVPANASLVGEHSYSGSGVPDGFRFQIRPAQDLMPALNLKTRDAGGATQLTWTAAPTARAYFAAAMGSNEREEMVLWTSSEVPETGMGLIDYQTNVAVDRWLREKVLLTPSTTTCTVPKGVLGKEGGDAAAHCLRQRTQLGPPAAPGGSASALGTGVGRQDPREIGRHRDSRNGGRGRATRTLCPGATFAAASRGP